MSNKIIPAVLFAAVILLAGFFVLNTYIYNDKQAPEEQHFEPYRAELAGEYVCLVSGTTPESEDCVPGIKTTSGDYYSINFALMSQMHDPVPVGAQISAAGVVKPIEHLSTDHWQQYNIKGIFSVTNSLVVADEEAPAATACDSDAKLCPDGSSVRRSGPRCEFSACPAATATTSTVTTYLGGTATGLGVSVNPTKVVSDSRCPAGVACIWAGTVEVQTVLTTPVSHGEHVLSLGKPQPFKDYTVTLTAVSPEKGEDVITDSSYRLTYTIVKNEAVQ
ncbi:MAG: hypothetical protein ACK4SL_02305 [Candidatus Paceibacteria bacterium]